MTISNDQIDRIASLSRIRITAPERAALHDRLGEILAMVDRLQAVDTDGIEPMAHPRDTTQRLRADTVTETDQRSAFQAIAPQAEHGLYLVPQVIE